ncbi:MAG: alanine--tRNA ligase-related protein, partial [Acidobacteriota bacterium]
MSVYETYDEQKQFACRVIADHARTTAFSIADGILPGNEGRAYVLRKIMRRAIYHGREHLNFHEAFFYKVCDFVVDQMKDAYPELETQREFIGKMVRLEEERFGNTMTVGLEKLKAPEVENSIDLLQQSKRKISENIGNALSNIKIPTITPEMIKALQENLAKSLPTP